jgi:hypothetical protein
MADTAQQDERLDSRTASRETHSAGHRACPCQDPRHKRDGQTWVEKKEPRSETTAKKRKGCPACTAGPRLGQSESQRRKEHGQGAENEKTVIKQAFYPPCSSGNFKLIRGHHDTEGFSAVATNSLGRSVILVQFST